MKKVGVSLPWDYLALNIIRKEAEIITSTFGQADDFLKRLASLGINSIELRHKAKELTAADMKKAIERVKRFDLDITIHGESFPVPSEFSIEKLFPWYKIVNDIYGTIHNKIMVTFHPLAQNSNPAISGKDTITLLNTVIKQFPDSICNYALENQRSRGYVDPGISFSGIVSMVSPIPDQLVGICWDMGHSYANTINHNQSLFPPKEFLERVVHTHIHDLGPTGRTHWPFKENQVPLEENIELLKSYNYTGVYNLELSFDRFSQEPDIKKLVTDSIIRLQKLIQ